MQGGFAFSSHNRWVNYTISAETSRKNAPKKLVDSAISGVILQGQIAGHAQCYDSH
jgi:hypothetical protein